jgi:hypothetical protein
MLELPSKRERDGTGARCLALLTSVSADQDVGHFRNAMKLRGIFGGAPASECRDEKRPTRVS